MKNLVKNGMMLGLLGGLLVSCNPQGPKKVELKEKDDKVLYTMGVVYSKRIKPLGLSQRDMEIFMEGFRDESTAQKLQVDPEAHKKDIQVLLKKKMASKTETVKKEGDNYLATFLKEDGAKKTDSGLAYKILKAGTGKKPGPKDVVEVHYHGTLINGDVFDSSVKRDKKVSFPLNRVIKGWTEGLQLIGEGGKIKLVIPAGLAYGDRGAPPKIPGGATLVFEVELFSIKAKKESKEKAKDKSVN